MRASLAEIVGAENVLPGTETAYLQDATSTRGFHGHADAIVLPGSAEEVTAVLAWCYANDVVLTTRGGGSLCPGCGIRR